MGTRHIIVVVMDKEYKVAQYGQFDGAPDPCGLGILHFLRNADLETFSKKCKESRLLTAEETNAKKKSMYKTLVPGLRASYLAFLPEFDATLSYKILLLILNAKKPVELEDEIKFAADGLYCEWGYVIDFDKKTFEVYNGCRTDGQHPELTQEDRFFHLTDPEMNKIYKNSTKKEELLYCHPIKMIHSFDMNNLPTDISFMEIVAAEKYL